MQNILVILLIHLLGDGDQLFRYMYAFCILY